MVRMLLAILLCYAVINADGVKRGIIAKIINGSSYDKIDTVNITATQECIIYGILFDADNNTISDSVLNNSIKWDICGGDSSKVTLSNKYGNKTIVTSNYAYSEYLIKMTCNNVSLDTITVIINPARPYKICVDTAVNTANTVQQITLLSDSISIYVYQVDPVGIFSNFIQNCNWIVLDSTQLSIEKTIYDSSKYVVKAKKNNIDTDLIFKIDSLFSDTIHVFKTSSSSISFQQLKINKNRHRNVVSYNLLGKKINNVEIQRSGGILIRLNNIRKRPIKAILVK